MASKRTGYLFSNILLTPKQRRLIWNGDHVKHLYQIHDRFENILQVNGNICGFMPKEIWKSDRVKPIPFDSTDLYDYTLSCPNAMYYDSAEFPIWVGPGDWVYYDSIVAKTQWLIRWFPTSPSSPSAGVAAKAEVLR